MLVHILVDNRSASSISIRKRNPILHLNLFPSCSQSSSWPILLSCSGHHLQKNSCLLFVILGSCVQIIYVYAVFVRQPYMESSTTNIYKLNVGNWHGRNKTVQKIFYFQKLGADYVHSFWTAMMFISVFRLCTTLLPHFYTTISISHSTPQ
jgi:hypothetical protein